MIENAIIVIRFGLSWVVIGKFGVIGWNSNVFVHTSYYDMRVITPDSIEQAGHSTHLIPKKSKNPILHFRTQFWREGEVLRSAQKSEVFIIII